MDGRSKRVCLVLYIMYRARGCLGVFLTLLLSLSLPSSSPRSRVRPRIAISPYNKPLCYCASARIYNDEVIPVMYMLYFIPIYI